MADGRRRPSEGEPASLPARRLRRTESGCRDALGRRARKRFPGRRPRRHLGLRTVARASRVVEPWSMDQRITCITLGVADITRARAFYEQLGWSGESPDGEVVFFQAGGLAGALWGRDT